MSRARKKAPELPAPEAVEVDEVLAPEEDEDDDRDEDEEELEPGVCQYCGCTQEQGCPQGCEWANDEQTICTVCEDQALELGLTVLDRLVELEGPIDRWSKQR